MTREEAIKKLQKQKAEYLEKWVDYSGVAEAYDMAIEALQAKTDGDLISRADVLALAEKGYIISNSNYKKVCDLINELPSADRPTELLEGGTLKVNVNNGAEVNRVLVWGDDGCGGLYYADDRPSGEWIPVSERMPMANEYVIVYRPKMAMPIIVDEYHIYYGEDDDELYEGWDYSECERVIAWMPLPKPYCPNCGAKMGGNK